MINPATQPTPHLAYSANVYQRDGRICISFSYGDELGRLTRSSFDIDPFTLQLAALLLQVMNEQAADREEAE